jgi:hypothetical protein
MEENNMQNGEKSRMVGSVLDKNKLPKLGFFFMRHAAN